ncbi:MAG: TssQ family T6SS-associated lipoprotein [Sulfurimicrobium sp.]|nr:TssQ family T6SS-associated lipoprotein [Sulfurimicrobium sp.]
MPASIYPRFLCLALLLTATGCTSLTATKPTPKSEEVPVVRKVEKIEEPSVKKPELPVARKAEQELNLGIHNYEEGNYKIAAGHVQNALDGGLASSGDQLTAHKYLAFIYCISGEKLACRGEFKQLLKLNPNFNLPPAEAGHPIWGPVFREVKVEAGSGKRRKK